PGPLLGRRMRIGQQSRPKIGLAIIAPPDLRPAEIEALITGQAVDHRRFLAVQRRLVGIVRSQDSGQIADILTKREFAFYMRAREHLVGVILLHQFLAEPLEGCDILWSPPVAEIALEVVLRALVVEMVTHLMADDRADAAIIDR